MHEAFTSDGDHRHRLRDQQSDDRRDRRAALGAAADVTGRGSGASPPLPSARRRHCSEIGRRLDERATA